MSILARFRLLWPFLLVITISSPAFGADARTEPPVGHAAVIFTNSLLSGLQSNWFDETNPPQSGKLVP
jgi:hypothetical protein